ncbi:MAG: PepSY domain-containing protein [Candidatus Riflebacteria bacterium]|nr:PepSY domain-containing protein [Candidatus Riflebacteria bacterium]
MSRTVALLLGISVVFAARGDLYAGSSRDVARVIKGLAAESQNAKVLEAVKVLEQEGFLTRVGEALGESQESPVAAATASQVAGGLSQEQAKKIALDHARPKLGANGVAAEVISVKEVKGPPHIFRVKIMPGTKATLLFFMSYDVDVDASTGQVLRMK